MANPAEKYGVVIADAFSGKPPRANTPEAAMQQVLGGSGQTEADSRYFDAFQKGWRQETAAKDLAGRVLHCIGLYVLAVMSSHLDSAEKVVGLKNRRAAVAAFNRFRKQVETEILSALLAKGNAGVTIWQEAGKKYESYLMASRDASAFAARVSDALVDTFAMRAAASAAKGGGMSVERLRTIADVQVRALIGENRDTFYKGAQAAVAVWGMPIVSADKTGAVLSLLNDMSGGVGGVASGVASLETELALAATATTVLNATGVGLAVVAALFAFAAYEEDLREAAEDEQQKWLERHIRKQMTAVFLSINDGITRIQDALAILCTIDAIKAGIDVQGIQRDRLRRFIWQRMFPELPTPEASAVAAYVEAKMDSQLTPLIKTA